MDLPKLLADLVEAQNNFDSVSYADCFSETAVVFDEGKNHKGKAEIRNWIEKANRDYAAKMKPISYSQANQVLVAEISGNFPGSPIVLSYRFEIRDGKIHALEIA